MIGDPYSREAVIDQAVRRALGQPAAKWLFAFLRGTWAGNGQDDLRVRAATRAVRIEFRRICGCAVCRGGN